MSITSIQSYSYTTPPSTPPRSPKRSSEELYNYRPCKIPRTPKPRSKQNLTPYQITVNKILASNIFEANGSVYSLGRLIGEGDFSRVFELRGNDPYREDYTNDELVVKLYNEYTLEHRSTEINRMNDNIESQYLELRAHKDFPLKVAEILNIETFKTDGYIIQEKVRPYNDHIEFEEMKEKIKNTFHFCYADKSSPIDLKPDNLGWNKQNKLTLFDFYEFRDKNDKFSYILSYCLHKFSPIKNEKYNYLDPSSLSSTPTFDLS